MSGRKRPPSGRSWQPDRYADHVKIDESRVPEELRHLIPYAKYWSIGDDVDRAKLMAKASKARKKALVDAVWPHWAELNTWCESNDWSDAGIIFTNLIEATVEARLEVYPPPPRAPQPPEPPLTPEQSKELEALAASIVPVLQGPFGRDPEKRAEAFARIKAFLDKVSREQKSKPQRTEPGTSPNGGPAVPPVDSGAGGGPPSVS
jgi:hypothetical protein